MNYFLTEKTDFLSHISCPHCHQRLRIDDRVGSPYWLETGYCDNCNKPITVEKVTITEVRYYVQKDESLPSDET
jgi:hypothetical protein